MIFIRRTLSVVVTIVAVVVIVATLPAIVLFFLGVAMLDGDLLPTNRVGRRLAQVAMCCLLCFFVVAIPGLIAFVVLCASADNLDNVGPEDCDAIDRL